MENSVQEKIREQINSDRIVMYIKGTKDFPMCGFSATVVNIFKQLGASFSTVNVLADFEVREGIKEYSNWPTIPQIYLNGEFIGGCDIVKDLYEKGSLPSLISETMASERKLI